MCTCPRTVTHVMSSCRLTCTCAHTCTLTLLCQVNVSSDLEGSELLAEKVDRREFIDLLKRMLTLDQERRITPGDAIEHSFIKMIHLMDYAHCNVYVLRVCTSKILYSYVSSGVCVPCWASYTFNCRGGGGALH